MKKVRTYLFALQQSVTNLDYYIELMHTKLWFNVQFFLLSIVLIYLCSLPYVALVRLPELTHGFLSETALLIDQIPESATFTLQDGILHTEGISLPLQIASTAFMQDAGIPSHLVEIRADDEAAGSVITLGEKSVHINTDQNPGVLPYSEIFPEKTYFSLTRVSLGEKARTFATFIENKRWQIVAVFCLVAALSSIFSGIFMILFYSLLIQGLAWIVGIRLLYKQAIRWGLHIYPICLALSLLAPMLYPDLSFPMMQVGYIAISLLIIWNIRQKARFQIAR